MGLNRFVHRVRRGIGLDENPRRETPPEERAKLREAGRRQRKARKGKKGKKRESSREARLRQEHEAFKRASMDEKKERVKAKFAPKARQQTLELADRVERGDDRTLRMLDEGVHHLRSGFTPPNPVVAKRVRGELSHRRRYRKGARNVAKNAG